MKKRLNVPQLNNKTIVKLLIFFAIVVLLEVVTAIAIFNQFSTKTYRQEYTAFNNKATSLSETLNANYTVEELNRLNEEDVQQRVLSTCSANGGFESYAIITVYDDSTDGKIIFSNSSDFTNGQKLSDIGIVNNAVSVAKVGDKTLIFAPISVGNYGFGIICASDFSASQANIDSLIGNVVALLIVCGVLVCVVFIGYAYTLVNKERTSLFRYKLTLSKAGKIISKSKSFKDDFSAIGEIKSPETLDRKRFTLVPLPSDSGEDSLLALRAVNSPKGIKVYGGKVSNANTFIQSNNEASSAGMSTSSLSNVFETFVKKGKRTLLGVLLIGNLEQIKTLFGKQTALDVQKIILDKTKEKFTYAFELDFGYIGVAYPDGKKLDILMTDLNDIFSYINEPLKVDVNLFTLDLKGGFAMCDETMNPRTFDHAFKAAEAARQRAIDTKVADYIVYHESQQKLYTRYLVTFDIKQMLSEDAFEMEYQPQYSIKEARVEGFEALFRVKKSWNVNVDTFSFITYAERTGAMVQLGDFIFDTGMKFAKSIEGKNVSVSLNVSPVQLMQAGFIENFLRIYRKYDLKPGAICVEITESFLMTNFAETLKKLTVLTQQGILVHLDDFGTEYSSLLYIKKLPISTIKIDKEFVKDVLESRESQAIIKFITNIAKLLNGTTICEGVETCKEFDMLNYLGCDTIQGWLISKSLKPDVAARFIDEFDYKQVVAAQQKNNQQKK
ncbi:MAG: EAL domain-containing protein [Candidatus Coproplasma sp.]